MKIVHLTIGVILSISVWVSGQDQWVSSGCSGQTPTLERIAINGCTNYDPDEYIIFHTNQSPFNLSSQSLEIRVEVQNGPFISNQWGSNSNALNALNSMAGCGKPVFLDPFSPPYNGTIPRQAKVWAFVQSDPQFSGTLQNLCSEEAIFVIFGNFSRPPIRSMFANTCTNPGCERNIFVELGNCRYDIVYRPDQFNNKKGDFITSSGSGVSYQNTAGCVPSFTSLPSPSVPAINLDHLQKCRAEPNTITLSALNGDHFTTWHFNPDAEPFHTGSSFTPTDDHFPDNTTDQPVSQSVWIYNYLGGRRSKPIEIKLTTAVPPFAEIILSEIECSDDYLEPSLTHDSHLYGNWSVSPPVPINAENGRISLEDLTDGDTYTLYYHVENETCDYTAEKKFTMIDCTCSISATTVNSTCIESGNPDDDTFTAQILVNGTKSNGMWRSSNGNWNGFYNQAETIGPFPIAHGIQTITITDADDQNCTTEVTLHPPPPCSDPCEINAEILNVTCVESGNPDDDTFTAQILISGTKNNGMWRSTDGNWNGFYNQPETIGPFPIAHGIQTITITDADDQNCTTEVTLHPPPPCSDPCEINAEILDITCIESGNPDDDTFTAQILVNGTKSNGMWRSTDGNWNGFYNQPETIEPFPIAQGIQTITITDADDQNCTTEVTLHPPPPCSDPCEINAEILNVTCVESGNPDDDTFTAQILVNGTKSNGMWQSSDGRWIGKFNQPETIGPFPISQNIQTITITDADDQNCTTEVTLHPPPPCSDPCEINAETLNVTCVENGNPDDDTFTAQILIKSTKNNGMWRSSDGRWIGEFNQPETIGPFPITHDIQTITITDADDQNCTTKITLHPPPPCSDLCEITAEILNITCIESGNPDDDTFTAQILVNGTKSNGMWRSTDGNWNGFYNQPETIGPFPIAHGIQNINITDADDQNCTTEVTLHPPPPCSDPCEINAEILNVTCVESGNPDDDTFTAQILISGTKSNGMWRSTDGNWNGFYNQPETIGPFPISQGIQTINIIDADDQNCTTEVTIHPPSPCSDPCEITAEVLNVTCVESGNPDDDTFTAQILVNNTKSNGMWRSSDGRWIGEYGKTETIGPFPIAQGIQTITITDVDDQNCTTEVTLHPPPPCSDPCEINAEIRNVTCIESGNPDDDTFTAQILVNNTKSNGMWQSSDGRWIGEFNQPETVGPFPIAQGIQTITIIDADDQNCTMEVTLHPPPCSDPCEITAEILDVTCIESGNPDDDTFNAQILVNSTKSNGMWQSSDGRWIGEFNQPETIGPFPISHGIQTITITDADDPNCTREITLHPPSPCSDPCEITAEVLNVTCMENGNPDDDTFTAQILINGTKSNGMWQSSDGRWIGEFNQPETVGPFPISKDIRTITITDADNQNCATKIDIEPPPPCTRSCVLPVVITDTTIRFENKKTLLFLTAISKGNTSTEFYNIFLDQDWIDIITYDEELSLGPFEKEDAGKQLTFHSSEDSSCQINFSIPSPECNDHLSVQVSPSLDYPRLNRMRKGIEVKIISDKYPVSLYHENQIVGSVHRNSTQYIPISGIENQDSVHLFAVIDGFCLSRWTIPIPVITEDPPPNIFTPNDDGINDDFRIFLPGCEGYFSVTVFDKWGSQIHQKTSRCSEGNNNIIWDGKISGKEANPGMYVYTLSYTSGGKSQMIRSEIILMR